MSRPWGQASSKASGRGTSAEGCGPAEVFDCGCRYAISEGWAPCALHANAEEMQQLLLDLLNSVNTDPVRHRARVLLERISRGWRHA